MLSVTDNQIVIDSSLPLDAAPLVKPGMEVAIDEPALGYQGQGHRREVAESPGTRGVDGYHIYFAVRVGETPTPLQGFSLRLTMPIKSTKGAVTTVPMSAVSWRPTARRESRSQKNGALEYVTVEPGIGRRRLRRSEAGRRQARAGPARGRGQWTNGEHRQLCENNYDDSARARRNHARVLELSKVGKTYGSEPAVHALVDVDLVVERGEWLSITGPSGAGKSTLLNIIGCLDRPTSGTYLFDGIDTAQLTDSQRAGLRSQRIGFVFQSFHLLPYRTVLENVMLAEVYRKQSAPRSGSPGAGGDRARRAQPPRRFPARQALRRRTAARGDRPGARRFAQPAAVRRADRKSRLEDVRQPARSVREAEQAKVSHWSS